MVSPYSQLSPAPGNHQSVISLYEILNSKDFILMESYNICHFVSNFLYLTWGFGGSSVLQHISVFNPFLWLNNIPLHEYTIIRYKIISELSILSHWTISLSLYQYHTFNYWSFVVNFEIKKLFMFFKIFWAIWGILQFQMSLKISFYISAKNEILVGMTLNL